MRAVEGEFAGVLVGSVAIGAIGAVATAIAAPPDAWASLIGLGVGAAFGLAIVMRLQSPIPKRYRSPQPWPTGVAAESSRRAFWWTVATMLMTMAVVVAAFELFASEPSRLYPFWTAASIVTSFAWHWRWRHLAAYERELGVTLYREVATPKRLRRSRYAYARR